MAALFRIAVFDSSLYPGLVLWSQVMGGVALLLTPWTVSALGRWQWLGVVSIVLGGVGLGLGLYISAFDGCNSGGIFRQSGWDCRKLVRAAVGAPCTSGKTCEAPLVAA